MSKRRSVTFAKADVGKVVALASELTDVPVSRRCEQIDWGKCFICQSETSEKLQCSTDARTIDSATAYDELGERMLKFHAIDSLPVPLDIEELSDSKSLGASLFHHAAKFHKKCKLKFGNEKLEKAMKRSESVSSRNEEKSLSITGLFYLQV